MTDERVLMTVAYLVSEKVEMMAVGRAAATAVSMAVMMVAMLASS